MTPRCPGKCRPTYFLKLVFANAGGNTKENMKKKQRTSVQRDPKVEQALACFIAFKNRESHPSGRFDRPSKRWYPNKEEKQECCTEIHPPSRAYPYALMTHCRSAKHVWHVHHLAHLVSLSEFQKLCRKANHSHKVIQAIISQLVTSPTPAWL